jgi:hypothetical protein
VAGARGLIVAFAGGSSTVNPAMRVHRQQATRVFLVLAVLLGSLWAGGLIAAAAGNPAGLAASHPQLGIQPAALRDPALALRSPVDRPGSQGRLVPLLLGPLAAALVAAQGLRAGWLRPALARGSSLVGSAPLAARAPPHLRSA